MEESVSEPHGSLDALDMEEAYFNKVIASFLEYETESLKVLETKRHNYGCLPEKHRLLLETCSVLGTDSAYDRFSRRLEHVKGLIKDNASFLNLIVTSIASELPSSRAPRTDADLRKRGMIAAVRQRLSAEDMERVESVLRQFVRDWSLEGSHERNTTYGPILDRMEAEFADVTRENRGLIRVLVPGAGLGRLVYELAHAGFSTQGNEFSFPMLFGSNYILNVVRTPLSQRIYPFVHSWSNQWSAEAQFTSVLVPDIVADDILPTTDFSMVAGEFLEVYRGSKEHARQWDAVITCYFIDTAHNVCDYIETIQSVLKPGGLWINLGPLQYHYENVPHETSLELNYEELRLVILAHGFEFVEERRNVPCTYAGNKLLMLQHTYNNAFFVSKLKAST